MGCHCRLKDGKRTEARGKAEIARAVSRDTELVLTVGWSKQAPAAALHL